MPQEKKSFVFFSSWERYLKTLELDRDTNYVNAVARAIIQYGLRGEVESEDPTILSRVEAVCADLMQSSTARYNAAINGGGKGGRPIEHDPELIKELYARGMTYRQIADELGCGVRTVQRAVTKKEEDDEI